MTETIVLSAIFIIPGLLIAFRNFLWDLYFWQIKEYRFDRWITHILWDQDEENRNMWVVGLKFICFAGLTNIFIEPIVAIGAIFLLYFIWLYEGVNLMAQIQSNKFKRPSIRSPRNIIIIASWTMFVSIVLIFIISPFANIEREISNGTATLEDFAVAITNGDGNEKLIYPDAYILLSLLASFGVVLDIASPLFSSIFVVMTYPFSKAKRDIEITKARAKYFKLHNNLQIIGITGSYGKTTTKEVLYELVKEKYTTIKTPENYNTDFGVATTILNKLKKDTDIFIAEMGAYKKGEIKRICENFPPDISIITGIDNQHLGLFGSKEKLFEAKSEILRYMKEGGTAIISGDDETSMKLLKVFDGELKIVTKEKNLKAFKEKYGIESSPKITFYQALNINESNGKIMFDFVTSDNNERVAIPIKGEHLVDNIMFAIVAAISSGVPFSEIKKGLENLTIKLPRLSIDTGDNGTTVVNDSYNSSSKGFIAAITVLNSIYDNKYEDIKREKEKLGSRIVISKGIFELGKNKRSIYQELFKQIKDKFDVLITTDNLLANEALHENIGIQVYKVKDYREMIFRTRKIMEPNDIILIEGKVHPTVMKELISEYA